MNPSKAWADNRPLWAMLEELQGSWSTSPTSADSTIAQADVAQSMQGEVAQQVLDVIWASPYPVTLQDAQFRFVDVNPAYLAFTGYEREQLIGRDALELQPEHIDPHSDTNPLQPQNFLQNTQPHRLNGSLITAHGHERHYRFTRRVLQDDAGQLTHLEVLQDSTPDITRLQTQQQQLAQLARECELMFSVSEVGLAFIRDGRIQRANNALAQLLGYTSDELVRLPMAALFFDDIEFERHTKHELAALRQQGRWLTELPLKRRDERLIWVQVGKHLVIEGDMNGGTIASYVNVDDRYRAEQSVALQADRTRAILDSVLVGIVTVGPCGIEWMNRSARRMFGGDLADFIDEPISTVATAESDHPFLQTQYLNELVEGQPETFECRVKARDGREFWVVGNVVATGTERAGRQLTYALLDIERRRQAEARTEQTQASLQRIIEAAPMAITLRDAKTMKVLQTNETAARIVGRTASDLIGMSLEEMHDAATAAKLREDMRAALRTSEVTKREYSIATNGQVRLWDARFMPLFTRDSKSLLPSTPQASPDQLLLVATDVTEQRLAQQAKFDAAIAQREVLVKEVHHRIKNNLQGVAGLLQQVAQRKPEVAPAMAEVITQVQAIAHVYGLQVGNDGPLRLASVLQAITASVQRTFGHPIALSFEQTQDGPDPQSWFLPEAESIPIALGLNELLTNAIKHAASSQQEQPHAVTCKFESLMSGVRIDICNRGQLKEGFDLSKVPGGVSGLGLVRALLPRRSATLSLTQDGPDVVAQVVLSPPGVQNSAQATTSLANPGQHRS